VAGEPVAEVRLFSFPLVKRIAQVPASVYDQRMAPKESREEWEEGLREMQQSITPAQGLRAAHQVAKRSSGAPIPDLAHLVRLVLGGASLSLGIVAFSSRIPYRLALGAMALIAGFCLGFTAFRWKRK
jgi:hypothetical protein